MSGGEEKLNKKDAQVLWLADRLALSLLLHRDLMRGIVMLPSREEDRESLRAEPEYERMLNTVRESLRRTKQ